MKLEDAAYPENPRIHRHAEKGTKPGFVVYEIEKDGHNDQEMDEERLQRRRRGAQVLRRTSRLAQILIWTVMITFPLFFISELLPKPQGSSSYQRLTQTSSFGSINSFD